MNLVELNVNRISYSQSQNGAYALILEEIDGKRKLPIVIGFGIRSPNQAALMSEVTDGVVIGSAVVDLIKKTLDNDSNLSGRDLIECINFTKEISKALKHN